MPVAPVSDWSAAVIGSAAAALALFFAAIPKLIGFLIILVVGWFIAGLIARLVTSVLGAVRFNELAERSGLRGFVRQMGVDMTPSRFIGEIAKWFVRLIALVAAFDALGLPAVSQVMQQFLLWIPNLVVAVIVLVIGGIAANALGRLVRGATAEADLGSPDLLATIARAAVWAFAILIALNQIGVAATMVNTLFIAFVGALALAFGLAFGLGARDTAGRMVAEWYDRGRRASPKMSRFEAAQSEARQTASEVTAPAGNGLGSRR